LPHVICTLLDGLRLSSPALFALAAVIQLAEAVVEKELLACI